MRNFPGLRELFGTDRPLIGMVHLGALPGAPAYGGDLSAVFTRAVSDARALAAAGFHGLLVENYNDVPFFPGRVPAETVAAMAVAVREVGRAVGLPLGVNVLRNDAASALGIAAATGARFIRVNVHTGVMCTDQGLLTGVAHETLRHREALRANVAIFADVWVKHAVPFPGADLEQSAQDLAVRGLADAIIVTGAGTGQETDLTRVARVKRAVPAVPILVGSGVTAESVAAVLGAAEGAIVGSDACFGGRAGVGIDPERAAAIVRAASAVPTR